LNVVGRVDNNTVAGSGLHSCILVLSDAQSASALMQLAKPDPIVSRSGLTPKVFAHGAFQLATNIDRSDEMTAGSSPSQVTPK